jgi:uncharacterized membrane protein YraQ (UPF0718 family)
MDYSSLVISLMALILGAIAYFSPTKLHLQGLKIAKEQALTMIPRVIMALIISGFFSVLIPTDVVATWLGRQSGIKGILIASLIGGFTPGGPIICFPIAVVLFKTGAGIPALISFLTAWSIFAFHRIIVYEVPFLGLRFVTIRILSSLVLPPLAGILAVIIEGHILAGQ